VRYLTGQVISNNQKSQIPNMAILKLPIFFLTILFYTLTATVAKAQEMKITGVVRDINTHRELSNVNIYIKDTQIGTSSDVAGRYLLRVRGATGQMIVVFRHIAYEPLEISLESLLKKQDIYLQPRVIPLMGATIEEERIQFLKIEKDLPQPISLIDAKNFEIRGYVDAGDLLRTDHSVQVEEELSGKKTVAIRGGNPDEVLVLYNGIKMNSSYDNLFDLSLIDLEDIERFEIIKGSNTALYGPEAFSGVINIVPKIEHDYIIRFQQRFGTYHSGNWGLHLHHKLNRLTGSYSIKQGGTKRRFADEPADKQLLENSSLHHTINISYSFNERSDGQPINTLGAMYIYTSLNHENQRDVESLSNFNELFSLKYTGDIAIIKRLDLSASFQRLEEEQYLAVGEGSLHRNIADRSIHFNADKRLKFGRAEFLLGYQFQHAELDFIDERMNFNEPNIGLESALFNRQHHGFVSIAKIKGDITSDFLQTVDLDVSFRYDLVRDKMENPKVRGDTLNPQKGSIIELFNENNWQEKMIKFALSLPGYRNNLAFKSYLSFGMNTRFPTLLQQICSPALITSAATQPNLNPEKNTSLELSIEVARDIRSEQSIYGWQISGNFFQNYYDNKFRISTSPGSPIPFYDNVPNAQISGVETKSSAFLFRKKVTVELGLSRYFISEKSAFPFKSDFKRTVNFLIDHAGYSFQIHWFKEGEQVGWIRQYDREIEEPTLPDEPMLPEEPIPFAEIPLPGYSNIDLHLSKTFQVSKLKLFINLSGRNLLDDEETFIDGLAIRDRRFYLTIGAQY